MKDEQDRFCGNSVSSFILHPSSLILHPYRAHCGRPGLSLTDAISGVRLLCVQPSSARRHLPPLIRVPRAFARAGMLRLLGGERSQGGSPWWYVVTRLLLGGSLWSDGK